MYIVVTVWPSDFMAQSCIRNAYTVGKIYIVNQITFIYLFIPRTLR